METVYILEIGSFRQIEILAADDEEAMQKARKAIEARKIIRPAVLYRRIKIHTFEPETIHYEPSYFRDNGQ